MKGANLSAEFGLTAGGFYRLGTWDLSEVPGKKAPAVTVDVLFGARYTYLDIELDIKAIHNPEGDEDWGEDDAHGL